MFSLTQRLIAKPQLARGFSTSIPLSVKVGDKIPQVPLYAKTPTDEINIADQLKGEKAVIVGVPGAFSGGCTKTHIPGYLQNLRAFNEKGYNKLFVVAVNDVFVMDAWASLLSEHSISDEAVKFLADPKGDFVGALDLKFDASKFFGNERSKRFALLVEDGIVKQAFVEPGNTSIDVSEATKVLSQAQ